MTNNPGGIRWQDGTPCHSGKYRKEPCPDTEYISKCCGSMPAMEIDIRTLTGFCGHCLEKAVFITEDEYEGVDKKSDLL